MTRRYTLHREQIVPVPLQAAWDYFSNADNLQAITPRWLRFRILTPPPRTVATDSRLRYRLRFLGIPFTWETVFEVVEPPRRFIDVQRGGPYKFWRHTHEFQPVPQGTLVTDTVEYELPWGRLGQLAHALFVGRSLKRIFDYRRQQIALALGPEPERADSATTPLPDSPGSAT